MALTKYKLGEFLLPYDCRNKDLSIRLFQGISTNKVFTNPKQVAEDISSTKIVRKGQFAYNKATTRNGEKISIAYRYGEDCAVSSAYQVFYIKEGSPLLPEYLLMFFKRPEFDRYVRCNSWGSAHEFFTFEDMCDVEIELPNLFTQQKYVDIYKAIEANQQCYERGLDDLKLVCDGYIEDLRRKIPCEKIGPYIVSCNEKNENNAISLFQGVTVDHVFTAPKRIAEDSENGSVVRTGQFAFNKVMKAHNTKLPIALREGSDCVVSGSYQVFEITDKTKLLPKYLMLWMNRSETQRYAGFISFGTTRDIFSFEDLCEIKIPIPNIEIQQSIVDIYSIYQKRYKINEQLKAQIKNICPILIKGSLEEGK